MQACQIDGGQQAGVQEEGEVAEWQRSEELGVEGEEVGQMGEGKGQGSGKVGELCWRLECRSQERGGRGERKGEGEGHGE